MESKNTPRERKMDAKELLLEDFRYLADSFWKNEQTGETRVNWFITIVTAVVGGLVSLAGAKERPPDASLRLIVGASLFALLVLGILTMFRMLTRNQATDDYKRGMDSIRQVFKDSFDDDGVLVGYRPFGVKGRRQWGGLAHIVAGINSLLFTGCIGVLVYLRPNAPQVQGLGFVSGWSIAGFMLTVVVQFNISFNNSRHKKRNEVTHAGGIVHRMRDGTVQYLLVGPKNGPAGEWLFPKGHIQKGEEHGEAARREVREETGVLARQVCLVGNNEFKTDQESVVAKYYLMECLVETQKRESRRVDWFRYDEALGLLTHTENKYLLQEAERKRRDMCSNWEHIVGAKSKIG